MCLTGGVIREAQAADLTEMITIERVAGEAFRHVGMASIADDPPATVDELTAFLKSGKAWVFSDRSGAAVAYLLAERLDDRAHIEQVSVHPKNSRRGIGAALIEKASRWSVESDLNGLSLTTFTNVPWNAPYYTRLGFAELPEIEWSAGIRHRVTVERSHGLHEWPRVVMVRGAAPR